MITADTIRVILADDHAVVRAGLKAVLGVAKDITVVGEASNGREAIAAVDRLDPDVVVMDLTMPEVDGVAATKEPSAARALARGLKRKEAHADERERYERLTERERDVLRLVASGFSAPEIGEKLFISPKTVDTYKQRIGEKLGLTHRSEYVSFALKLGLLSQ